jgi:tetratricopeptide (TPR) repeat protein
MVLGHHRSGLSTLVIHAVLAFGLFAPTPPLTAQQSTSNSGQNSSPPPQTKPAPSSNDPSDKPTPDNNAFPEDVSRKAEQQKKADASSPQAPPAKAPASDANGKTQSTQPGEDDNAFPEETSRKAADAAKAASDGSASGVSSSSDYDDRVDGGREPFKPNVPMTHIHTKDVTKEDVYVGTFYLQSGDYVGAYARFKEASTLHPENVDAMFGLAEAARHLKKNDEAMENYRLYLDVVPNGSKAKDARKALASLEKPH